MIYPDDYKCLMCKFQYYGCPQTKKFKAGRRTRVKVLLGCSSFVRADRKSVVLRSAVLPLMRCFFGVCPQKIVRDGIS